MSKYLVLFLSFLLFVSCNGRIKSPPENPVPSDQPADTPPSNTQAPDTKIPDTPPPNEIVPESQVASGITFWYGCGSTITGMDKVMSCPFVNTVECPCQNTAKFYDTVKDSAQQCKTAGKIFAIWVESDLNTSDTGKDIAQTWINTTKDTISFLKTSGLDKDTIEACLVKSVEASAPIEKFFQ